MDRYEAIDRAADLGGIEMFPDWTPDLRKENDPAAGGNRREVDVKTTRTIRSEDMPTIAISTDKPTSQLAADLIRVVKDLRAEGLVAEMYDCLGLALDMRARAGDQHLDVVSDNEWSALVDAHKRAPWPAEVAR